MVRANVPCPKCGGESQWYAGDGKRVLYCYACQLPVESCTCSPVPRQGTLEKVAQPEGACFIDAWRQLRKMPAVSKPMLAHGRILKTNTPGETRRIPHAWVEFSNIEGENVLWEPQQGVVWDCGEWYSIFKPEGIARYSKEDASVLALRSGNYGPWDENNPGLKPRTMPPKDGKVYMLLKDGWSLIECAICGKPEGGPNISDEEWKAKIPANLQHKIICAECMRTFGIDVPKDARETYVTYPKNPMGQAIDDAFRSAFKDGLIDVGMTSYRSYTIKVEPWTAECFSDAEVKAAEASGNPDHYLEELAVAKGEAIAKEEHWAGVVHLYPDESEEPYGLSIFYKRLGNPGNPDRREIHRQLMLTQFEDQLTKPTPTKGLEGMKLPPLRPYQEEALAKYLAVRRGVIVLPTGTGKTIVALAIMQRIGGTVAVVVPTISLLHQWESWIRRAGYFDVGMYYGEVKWLRPVTVFTYQSAIRVPEELVRFDTIILDEVHHMGAPEYSKLLDVAWKAQHMLGLTATIGTRDSGHKKVLSYAPVVYSMTIGAARQDGFVSEIEILPVESTMNAKEREKYEEYSNAIRRAAAALGTHNVAAWNQMAGKGISAAYHGLAAISHRRMLLAGVEDKRDRVLFVVDANKGKKVFLFSESIDSIEKLSEHLKKAGHRCEVYHSELAKAQRQNRLNKWGVDFDVLLSVRTLEEGIDVPTVSIGIIMASGKTPRQLVQRIGRIIRPLPGKVARIYVVYVPGTTEDAVLAGVRTAVSKLR